MTSDRRDGTVFIVASSCILLLCGTALASGPHGSGSRGPTIVLEPPTVVEFSSETGAILPCSAQGQPQPSIRWEKEDGSLASTVPGLRETRSDGSLVLPAFGPNQFRPEVHSATYRCVASNTVGLVKSRLAHVHGVVLEKFVARVYDVYVVQGNSALLRCHVPPTVKDYVKVMSWVLDDGVTIGTLEGTGFDTRYLMLPTGELIVRDVNSADSQRSYRCQVQNVLTGQSHLSPTSGKTIITDPCWDVEADPLRPLTGLPESQDVDVVAGVVDSSGSPDNITAMPDITRASVIISSAHRLDMFCSSPHIPYSESCLTEPHSQLPPRMIEYGSVVQVEQGERAVLPCLSEGHPSPKHYWYRLTGHGTSQESSSPNEGEGYLALKASDRVFLLPEGPLILHKARIQDNGRYVCVANNSDGEDKAHVELLVTVPLSARIEPAVQIVDVGRGANLSCRVAGHPVHGILWTHNGFPISSSHSANPHASVISRSGSRNPSSGGPSGRFSLLSRDLLHVTAVERQDGGMYQCTVYNREDSAQGSSQLVIGEDAPALEHVFSEHQLRPGGSVSLRCSASGNPLPQVTWSLDGTPVPEHYHVRVGDYVSGERLVHSYVNLTGVRVEDGGIYTCVARNGVGHVSHSARLNVLGRPLIRPMANVTALAGRNMRLHCAVAGHPIQSIVWQKDGRSLPQNHRQHSFPNGSLLITEVQRSVDSGWYACVARDPQGNTARGQLAVHVMTPPLVSPFSFPDDLTEGKRAGAACIISEGDLPITIEWLKDGLPLDPELEASVAKANDYTSFLSFTGVRQLHSGNYTCVASNPATSSNYSAEMIVRVPPMWRQEPVDKAAVMGQAVTFDCQADGFPVPVIRWKKEHRTESGREFAVIISNANVQILENGSLSIREADRLDAGHYMCQALNGVGPGISTVVKLDVHVAPHFERKFHALTVRRGDNVALTCRAVGEPPITVTWLRDRNGFSPALEPRYVVEEKTGADALEYVLRIPSVDRRDSSLFSCFAENAYGRDDTSFQVVVQEPPEKPRGLELSQSTSRSVTISWTAPYSGNSAVTKYRLEFKHRDGTWKRDSRVSVVDASETSHVISSLRPKTAYEFRLRAENAIGLSEFSDSLMVTTDEEAPSGAPRDIKVTPTGSRSIRITWKPPLDEDSNDLVQGYYVGYRVRDAKESFAYKTLESSAASSLQQCELTDLRRNTRYSVVVQAFNAKGAGPVSEEVHSQTLEIDPPMAPQLKLISSTSSSVHLSWTIVRDQPVNGFVLFHKVEPPAPADAQSAEDESEWSEVQTGSERSAYAYRGLRCGRKYSFYVVAFNAAGRGPHSNVVHAKTDGSVPLAPEHRDLVESNVTSVTLQLGAWKSGGCPISSFTILYKPQSNKDWSPATSAHFVPDQQQPAVLVIPDLMPATWYDLLVTAQNDAGATEAEYVFATLTLSGGTVPPPQWTQAVDAQRRQIRLILPIVSSLLVLVLVSAVVCYVFCRRRLSATPRRHSEDLDEAQQVTKPIDTMPMSVWEKPNQQSSYKDQEQHAAMEREQLYYPSPYDAGGRRLAPLYAPEGLHTGWASAQSLNGAAEEPEDERTGPHHTYDVPFLRSLPNCRQDLEQQLQMNAEDELMSSTERFEKHIYSKPAIVYMSPEKCSNLRKTLQAGNIIESYPNGNASYVYSRPKKKHWRNHDEELLYADHKLRKLSRYADELKQAQMSAKDTVLETGVEAYELSEAECDMPTRRFAMQR